MNNRLIIIGALVVAIIGTVFFWQQRLKQEIKNQELQAEEAEIQVPSINGVMVNESIARTRPIAVVVENHTNSRPQSGLTDADIVYETLAEGGITRFLALYQTKQPKEIGPVRSARPYFNTIADQWSAVYAHVGGSTIALSELSSGVHKKLDDINQFFYGDYFYRSKDRVAPHNAYTSLELLRALVTKKKWGHWQPTKLGQYGSVSADQPQTAATEVSAKFFDANYAVKFTYDPATNTYKRINGGKAAIDKNNSNQISPTNVLVQFVDDYSVPLETATGLGLYLDRSGRAILFTEGNLIDGNWKGSKGVTEYTATASKPMSFQPGQTWIILMPKSLSANITWQ